MFGTPRKSSGTSPPSRVVIDDTAIQEFVRVMDATPTDQWNKRTNAFSALVSLIPDTVEGDEEWFSNAKTLRHLASPLSSLLKDSRSTVVKRTCENCTVMFQRCGPIARYLMKDIMPAVMAVHAQTVQVIRTYVQTMISDALVHVPCKAAMPIWLEKLKTEKSRTVREASAIYLLIAIENWDLTRDIWIQVAQGLLRSLRDPSPLVREYVKQGLHIVRLLQPDLWDTLLCDPSVTKDMKLKRFLMKLGADDDDDVSSIASRGSLASLASNRSTSMSVGGGAGVALAPRLRGGNGGGLGPPLRVTTAAAKSPTNPTRNRARSPTLSPIEPRNGVDVVRDKTFVAGVAALKRQASETRSRRSTVMKDRWSRSSSSLLQGEEQDEVPIIPQHEPEHLNIARELLEAHKKSVDGMMAIIRLEMDTLDDFESSSKTEEEVLTYFEALVLCLEKRAKCANELQLAMDAVSAGSGGL
jgi:hypothetical protein